MRRVGLLERGSDEEGGLMRRGDLMRRGSDEEGGSD